MRYCGCDILIWVASDNVGSRTTDLGELLETTPTAGDG